MKNNKRGEIKILIPMEISSDVSIELYHHIQDLCKLLSDDKLEVTCNIK